jgi:predicted transcriptional regulator
MGSFEESRLFEKLLSSDAKADLLVLFNENPSLTDKTDGIARRIGRESSQIDYDLKDLIDIGLLAKKGEGNAEVIRYDPKRAAEIRELISSQIQKSLESD